MDNGDRHYSLILLVICLLLTGLACSDDPALKARYQAEKLYFQADKLTQDARIKPELATKDIERRIFEAYYTSLDFSLASLTKLDTMQNLREFSEISSLAHRAAIRLSKMYFADKQYDTCVSLMTVLLDQTRLGWEEQIAVHINLAHALQADGQFDSATAVYIHTIDSYQPPVDGEGNPLLDLLNIPMYLVRTYSMVRDTANMMEQYTQAVQYYQDLIAKYPQSKLGVASRGNLARLYYDFQRWEEAISQLANLVDSSGQTVLSARLRIADIRADFLKQFDRSIEEYDQISKSLKDRDTLYRPVIMLKKSLIALERRDYREARRLLVDIGQKYPAYYEATPQTQYLKARSFDMENNWDRAEDEYEYLLDQSPLSHEAMATYLYLANQLSSQKREREANQYYDRAEEAYSLLAARGSGTAQEARALTYKADLYRQRGHWDKAAELLASISVKFPESRIGQESLLTAAAIYREKLDNPVISDSLLTEFKKKLPSEDEQLES